MTSMGSKSERIWWEKTVEYKFLLSFCRGKNVDAYPLAGTEEEAGDAFFSIDNADWGLFEFKRDATVLNSELEKFAVEHQLFLALQTVLAVSKNASVAEFSDHQVTLNTCANKIGGGLVLLKALLAQHTGQTGTILSGTRPRQAGPRKPMQATPLQAGARTAEFLQKQARVLINQLRREAFEDAKAFLFTPDKAQQFHWIVYGAKDAPSKGMKLYRLPYFELAQEPHTGVPAAKFKPNDYVGWNRNKLVEYVRHFINFKRYGEPISDDDGNGGGRSWPEGMYQDHPSYIVGVDGDQVLWAPLDDSSQTLELLNLLSTPPSGPTSTFTPSGYT